MKTKQVTVIGGGLAGCEAAYYLARHGIPVTLIEMKPKKRTPAHEKDTLGELVCSNSLKHNDPYANACGLLKEEMRRLGSLIVESADMTKIPAGSALAVDRDNFSSLIDSKIKSHPLIQVVEEEVLALPELQEGGDRYVMIATGPLTADALAEDIKAKLGGGLHFYDA
nr:FAD-dependent oxidoreductase [Clostridia bacterium]